jgi:hypothetical protein
LAYSHAGKQFKSETAKPPGSDNTDLCFKQADLAFNTDCTNAALVTFRNNSCLKSNLLD